ncbi:MAG: phosphate signaling complex protein PhoU [Acidimicrobiia bacterium]|nr:phosphate signaling complex protein PhoU [Acidimicrobiia bacterium]NNF63051.1 phosphate signaling complex protein PhoU [Acidimicrobiia bacterium]
MTEIRKRFHDELQGLESDLQRLAHLVDVMLEKAVELLTERPIEHTKAAVKEIVNADDEVDDLYLTIERRWHEVMAMQTPVAIDLRFMSAVTHINAHLERMGDVAVNIAKTARKTRKLPFTQTILDYLQEMGDATRHMIRTAMRSFAQRDHELALTLPTLDDEVDRLNRKMYREVGKSDSELIDWAIRMMIMSRYLERVGDHAVDIAEQVAFLVTGVFREFGEVEEQGDEAASPEEANAR